MSTSDLRLERLDGTHDIGSFTCGRVELDEWLARHALAAQQMDSARTFVAVRSGRVVGCFSLTMGSVVREEAPKRLVRGMPAYPVPMVLLARLAVDQREQGAGLGTRLRIPLIPDTQSGAFRTRAVGGRRWAADDGRHVSPRPTPSVTSVSNMIRTSLLANGSRGVS